MPNTLAPLGKEMLRRLTRPDSLHRAPLRFDRYAAKPMPYMHKKPAEDFYASQRLGHMKRLSAYDVQNNGTEKPRICSA